MAPLSTMNLEGTNAGRQLLPEAGVRNERRL